MQVGRREFLQGSLAMGAAAMIGESGSAAPKDRRAAETHKAFLISLAEWSVHKSLFAHKMDHLDFPRFAKEKCGIDAVEYVNQFFKDKAEDDSYLAELNKRCKDLGVTQVLIMCDGEGHLGDPDEKKRQQAVKNHHKWVTAAKTLGCHSIRVNAHSEGSPEEQHKLCVDGLGRLVEFGAAHEINVIVENHGGLSSNGEWLAGVIKAIGSPRAGTLPDFGNFGDYDRYKGVELMMPYAKGVSAKTYDFDSEGKETKIDYRRMMKIVAAAGYHGRVGIEYEGDRLGELEGIVATKKILESILATG